jgi:hypothetical protein
MPENTIIEAVYPLHAMTRLIVTGFLARIRGATQIEAISRGAA